MNEDLYDTGSAVVGLYRLFTNFLKFPGESSELCGSIGGVCILGGTIPETGKKYLITLSAHNIFYYI